MPFGSLFMYLLLFSTSEAVITVSLHAGLTWSAGLINPFMPDFVVVVVVVVVVSLSSRIID